MHEAFHPIHKTFYLFEIKHNNLNFTPAKKNGAVHLITDSGGRKTEFLRQFFPEMAIFTVNI